ncbi:uncharacterized protein BDZ99DRAFT_208964 [Mytilinidion resinicola]|uniref:Uncharacterized protein n=1 Tax=Mytilinidion resinicola TaxID=574789 RepID=A0A6A6Y244_9PEZI|nr:uncharacterized protein BDZ99DRAFT_208964 [Mytilinidion resinicola]KAF2802074.1 hypothetical protein BDZ99DRAFT_208964 [Mytilinidion resinicola]
MLIGNSLASLLVFLSIMRQSHLAAFIVFILDVDLLFQSKHFPDGQPFMHTLSIALYFSRRSSQCGA